MNFLDLRAMKKVSVDFFQKNGVRTLWDSGANKNDIFVIISRHAFLLRGLCTCTT